MRSPVIYIFFNRPELTRRTFSALRAQRPPRLHLIADGPRPSVPTDAERCRESRVIVESLLDWPCEVSRDYSETNLGCGLRISSGLTTAFALLGEAIVLEDDVLPHPDFFPFCAAMLAAHRHDPHVHAISGFQALGRFAPARGGVVPSTFNCIWGWASWQRAWRDYRYDIDADSKNPVINQGIRDFLGNELNYEWHRQNFASLAEGRVDTWDFQWNFAAFARRRVTLISAVNLIRNLGFAAGATHTHNSEPYLEGLRIYPLEPSAHHRDLTRPDRVHDRLFGEIIHARTARHVVFLRLLARFPGFAAALGKS